MAKVQIAEFTDYITPDGLVYNFDDVCRFLISQTGMGMPKIKYITNKGPFQHGETVIDYRLQKRIIQMIYREDSSGRQAYWNNRNNLLDFMRPNRQAVGQFNQGSLRKKLPNEEIRQIDVFIERGPTFEISSRSFWDEWGIEETLRFIAYDPTFYDPNLKIEVWSLSVSDHLIFPFTFRLGSDGDGLLFETSVIDNDIVITYTGTWLSFPTITIVGPLIGLVILNSSTNERLELNHEIAVGETVIISLEFGNKTITSDLYGNLYSALSSNSDLATFHIAPDPEVANGINTINVTGGGALVGTTSITLKYYTRFIGI